MSIDMGQADRTLRIRPLVQQHKMAWTFALNQTARAMGYDHHMDVPDERVEELKSKAHALRGTVTD